MAQQQHQRILAAIVFTDVVGYSARMQIEEDKTITLVKRDLTALQKICQSHDGKVIKDTGDGLFMYFSSLDSALKTSTGFLEYLDTAQRTFTPDKRLEHRVGIHLGDVVVNDADVLGDGVNIAARLMALAQPDTICISYSAYEFIKNRTKLHPQFIGPQQLKNIKDPVTAVLLSFRPPLGVLLPEPEKASSKPVMNLSKLILYIGVPLTALIFIIVSYISLSKSDAETDQSLEQGQSFSVAVPTTLPAPAPSSAGSSSPASPSQALTRKTNFLPLIDLKRDSVRGAWTRTSDGLRCEIAAPDAPFEVTNDCPSAARLALPLAPSQIPREYDFNVSFTRHAGSDSIALIFVSGSGIAAFEVDAWGKNLGGIQEVDYRNMMATPGSTFTLKTEPGQRYNLSLHVRKDRISMFVDDKELASLDTDGSNLNLKCWTLKPEAPMGIGAFKSGATFHTIELIPVNSQ